MVVKAMKRFWGLLLLTSMLLVTGCASPSPTPVPPSPTPPFTLIPALVEAERNEGKTWTPIPSETATETPTFTPSSVPTNTATNQPTDTPTPTLPPPLPPEVVRFLTLENIELSGTFYRAVDANAPLVVLVHQARGDQGDWLDMGYVQYLRNQGEPYPADRFVPLPGGVHFSVFTFDLRGHGKSKGEYNPDKASTFMEDIRAALVAVQNLPGIDPAQIAAVGSSTGSAVIFRCAEICAGVMSVSLYPSEAALSAIQELDGEGAVVYCVSEFPCPEYVSERYVSVEYSGAGHGYELLAPGLDPEPGQVFYSFLWMTFGFENE